MPRRQFSPSHLVHQWPKTKQKLSHKLHHPWLTLRSLSRRSLITLVAIVVVGSSLPLFLFQSHASASTMGPSSPTADTTVAGSGTVNWTSPGNILASDSTYASAALASTNVSYDLEASGFGFTIPTGSTINGIQVDVEEYSPGAADQTAEDSLVELMQAGTPNSSNYATTNPWPTTDTYVTYGSASDLWGLSWTPAQIDASNFGVAIAAQNVHSAGKSNSLTAYVDYVRVTVNYTLPVLYNQSAYRWFNDASNSPPTTFVQTWGSTGYDEGYSVVQTSDGGYAVTGDTTSYGAGSDDMFLAKYDSTGTLTWSKTWGGTSTDYGTSVVQTTDGGYAVTGYTASYGAGASDMFLNKYDSSGNLSWSRTWGGTGADYGNSVVQTSDGGYAVTGDTASYGAGGWDMFLVKYDSTGTLTWSQTWGGTGADYGNSVVQTADGGYAVTGDTASYGAGGWDMFLVKYDSTGTLTWSQTWGGTGADYGNSVVQTADGGYAVTGYTASYGAGSDDMFLAKYDSSGNLSWSKTWGGTGSEYGNSLVQTGDGGYAVTGYTNSYGAGSDDMFLAKYDSSGNLSWSKTWGGTGSEYGNSLVQTGDDGYAVTGYTNSYGAGGADLFLVKYDSNGNISGCPSAECTSPTASTTSPTASTSSPTASTSSPTASTSSPAASTSSPTVAPTIIVDSEPLGSPLASTNTAATAPSSAFRLRLLLGVSQTSLAAQGQYFTLQYALQSGGSCSATPTGNFANVTSTTPIAYYDNKTILNTAPVTANSNDPTDGTNTVVQENYERSNDFTNSNNAITAGQDGEWDFSLYTYSATAGQDYCFRAVKSGGTLLDTYTQYPELIVPSPTFTQAGYRWFDNSGGPSKTFIEDWGGTGNEEGYSLVHTTDGGYAVTGYTTSYGAGGDDMFLAKFDSTGALTWSRTWGGTGNDYGQSVVQTSDGGYAVTGYTSSYGAGGDDMFLAKFDSTGALTWSRTWGGTGADEGYSLVQTSDGGYAVTGYTSSYGAGGDDMFLAKFDSSGALTWSRTWGGTGADEGYSLVQTSDGGYAVTGQTLSYGDTTNGDMFLAKFDSTGALTWSSTYGLSGAEMGNSVVQTSDGGYVVAGYTEVINSFGGSYQALLVKYDSSGTVTWSNILSSGTIGNSVIQTSDGGYMMTGGNGMFIAKYDGSGNLTWSRGTGNTGVINAGFAVTQTSDGGYAVAGWTNSYGAGGDDVTLSKYDSNGNINNCPTSMCINPGFTSSAASPTTSSPAASTSSPAASTSSPTATTSSPSATITVIVANSVLAGTPLASSNTNSNGLHPGDIFRLRLLIAVDGSAINTSGQYFNLQVATAGSGNATCNANLSYSNITATSTPVKFAVNSGLTDGSPIAISSKDPTDGTRMVTGQDYLQSDTDFTNNQSAIYGKQDGEWEAALQLSPNAANQVYCFRAVTSTGTALGGYSTFPQLGAHALPGQRMRLGNTLVNGIESGLDTLTP